ncbi:aa3-type cytochrome oxidase subunit IV [Streptomyces sp. GS7]|uniref:aa3-type cytochrome oxidase subunit IV n=1 Tax=Streptomyces sp. GS7 TaxID=2692234 RepID=UPI00131820A5|nr:cytochrome c oxidase subunit 4 [Streptomyces sp. GS7]QHC23450.1 cytochrome c oxidase subunit 4 [Streptomyces sp. GS7]
MKIEGRLFVVMALYFGGTAAVYGWRAEEPAGTAALTVAFLMSSLVACFYFVQYRKRGLRSQDRRDAEVADTAGPLAFFPPRSGWPLLTGLGLALSALGVVFGLWLFVIGMGVLGGGVFGFVFQYVDRDA